MEREKVEAEGPCPPQFINWEALPLEVYEAFVKYLDGKSLLNLCWAAPYVAARALEPFDVMSQQHRQEHLTRFCVKSLDHSVVCQIFRSFIESDWEPDHVDDETIWELVFRCYVNYRNTLCDGDAEWERHVTLEEKLRAESLCAFFSAPKHWSRDSMEPYHWNTLSGGGTFMVHTIFPNMMKELHNLNMATTYFKEDGSPHYCKLGALCPEGNYFLGIKLVDFPYKCERASKGGVRVERLVISACNECITLSPMISGSTAKIFWPEPVTPPQFMLLSKCPVFEVYENIVVLWPRPESLMFFVVVRNEEEDPMYRFTSLYQLPFKVAMRDIWNKLVEDPLSYVSSIKEYSGRTALLGEYARGMLNGRSGYLFPPSEEVFFGLTLTSPINGVVELAPTTSADGQNSTVQKRSPVYGAENGRKYVDQLKKPTCSAHRMGTYIFCSDTAIAMSQDCDSWVFGKLCFSFLDPCKKERNVSHVQVLCSENDLLCVINEDIVVAQVIVRTLTETDRELEIIPSRLFKTGLAPLGKSISQIQLDFDQGLPFILVVTKDLAQCEEGNDAEENPHHHLRSEFNFNLLRINMYPKVDDEM